MFVCILVQKKTSSVFVGTAALEFVVFSWDLNRCPAVAHSVIEAFSIMLSAVVWLFQTNDVRTVFEHQNWCVKARSIHHLQREHTDFCFLKLRHIEIRFMSCLRSAAVKSFENGSKM